MNSSTRSRSKKQRRCLPIIWRSHSPIPITPGARTAFSRLVNHLAIDYWSCHTPVAETECESSVRGSGLLMNGESTKPADQDELRTEYKREDLGAGVRGKHYTVYQEGTNLVLLSPDVAKAFPTDEAVNEAPRSLMPRGDRPHAAK